MWLERVLRWRNFVLALGFGADQNRGVWGGILTSKEAYGIALKRNSVYGFGFGVSQGLLGLLDSHELRNTH